MLRCQQHAQQHAVQPVSPHYLEIKVLLEVAAVVILEALHARGRKCKVFAVQLLSS